MTKTIFAALGWVLFGVSLAATGQVAAAPPQNQFGVVALPGTTWTPGSCVVIAAPVTGTNTFVLAPATCPAAATLSIGMAVQGGSPGAMLATDANTKLTLVNGLLAD